MNSFPTWQTARTASTERQATQKRLNRKYDIHHNKPCRLSIRIQPVLSFSVTPSSLASFQVHRWADKHVLHIAPWAASLQADWFWASCWGREWEEQNEKQIPTRTRQNNLKNTLYIYTHTDMRIDVKGGVWLHIHPHTYTGKIKVENRQNQKLTYTYSRWRHYCKQSPSTICDRKHQQPLPDPVLNPLG